MYPAPTSFMGIQVALARYLSQVGWLKAFVSKYEYWYLGLTPFKYLTGPIVPGLMVGFKKLLPDLNWFEILWILMAGFYVLGIWLVYWLIRELEAQKKTAALSALLFGLGWFSVWFFKTSDGLSLISFSMGILALIMQARLVKKPTIQKQILLCISICFVILVNSLILPNLVLGMIAVILSDKSYKKIEIKIKKSFLSLLSGLILASLWYGLNYWWILLTAPSFAGKPAFAVISQVAKLMPLAVGLGLALVSASILRLKSRLSKFVFYYLSIFLFLSFLRFIADPDFIIDWLAYGRELQLGIGFLGAIVFIRLKGIKKIGGLIIIAVWLTGFGLLFKNRVINSLRQNIAGSVEDRVVQVLEVLVEPEETVFLSGSPVFWLNALTDIKQVRGGADKSALGSEWREAAWEIREGEKIDKSIKWMDKLEIDWLVVHTQESEEYFKDFKNPDKFEESQRLKKVYDYQGDRVYWFKKETE